MAEPERRGAYIKGGEMRGIPKTAGEMRREAARKVKAKHASQLKAMRTASAPKSKAGDVGKPAMTRVNPATHKANLESGEKVAEATATTSRERSAAMDDWSHIKKLEKDAAYQATQDKGTSRKAKGAKGATKDDYAHIAALVKDAAYDAKKRREKKFEKLIKLKESFKK